MGKTHHYNATIKWTGNRGTGTTGYTSYDRDYIITVNGKSEIMGSSDPAFRGDSTKHNPEDLFLASLSSCHMLWYLHLCSVNKVIVLNYIDNAEGKMQESENGSGRFTEVTLSPEITIANNNMKEKAAALHGEAGKICFIANSVNFPVKHRPVIIVA